MKIRLVAAAGALAVFAVFFGCASKSADKKGQEGYRGVSISLPGHQLAFVNSGDYVDVLVTFDAAMKTQSKEKVTATILQNVLVADVIKPAKLEDSGVIELYLNPIESQYAALAAAQGTIDLSIRAEGDTEMHPMEMASLRKLFK
jgi:Flp pilus assembly protein CpaB